MIIDLTIIIVNYKSWEKLTLCLISIQNQSQINIQTIVVDNFSNDNKLKDFQNKYKQVNWIENKNNLGFARACNIGALQAESKWLLFLNPDTILDTNSLSSLIKYSNSNNEHRLIGIKQLNQNGSNTNAYGLFLDKWTITGFFRIFNRMLRGLTYEKMNAEEISYPDWISGSFVLLRKIDFLKLDGWNEKYWMYYEDMDLCKRAEYLNLKISLFNNWKCIHFHGESSRKNKTITLITKTEVIKSSHIYIQNHFKHFNALSLHLTLIISRFINLLFGSIISSSKRRILMNCLVYWKISFLSKEWSSDRAKNI
ncbi:MAG: glycosyltransferase family 2 protein [Flavobacteriaceae bacterium]|nr:glycosyltransferase family 2 protein [Flavobacteriaceae bacterium]